MRKEKNLYCVKNRGKGGKMPVNALRLGCGWACDKTEFAIKVGTKSRLREIIEQSETR